MATEAQTLANQANASRSKGPTSPEGKMQSRMNSLKHGMTGAGIVLPEADALEVHRRITAFAEELDAQGELEYAFVRRAALNSLRMERAADQQTAALSEHIRQVEADFVAPEGLDEAQVARLRAEAVRRAMFDTSREATLARKYEAAAERGFYRALKELRVLQKPAKGLDPAAKAEVFRQELGSFCPETASDAELDAMIKKLDANCPSPTASAPNRGAPVPPSSRSRANGGSFEVPFAVGKAR
jgi:hypothetical protein